MTSVQSNSLSKGNTYDAKKQIWSFLNAANLIEPTSTPNDITVCALPYNQVGYNVVALLKPEYKDSAAGLERLNECLKRPDFAEQWAQTNLGESARDGSRLYFDPETKCITHTDMPEWDEVFAAELDSVDARFKLWQAGKSDLYDHGTAQQNILSMAPAGADIDLNKLLGALRPQAASTFAAPPLLELKGDNDGPDETASERPYMAAITNFNTRRVIDYALAKFVLYILDNLSQTTMFMHLSAEQRCELVHIIIHMSGSFCGIVQTAKDNPNVARLIDFTNAVMPTLSRARKCFEPADREEHASAPASAQHQHAHIMTVKGSGNSRSARRRGHNKQQAEPKYIKKPTPEPILYTNTGGAYSSFTDELVIECEKLCGPMLACSSQRFATADAAQEYGRVLLKRHNLPLGQFTIGALRTDTFHDMSEVGLKMPSAVQFKAIGRRNLMRKFDGVAYALVNATRKILPGHNLRTTIYVLLAQTRALAHIAAEHPEAIEASRRHGYLQTPKIMQIIGATLGLVYKFFRFHPAFGAELLALARALELPSPLTDRSATEAPATEFYKIIEALKDPAYIQIIYNELDQIHHAAHQYFGDHVEITPLNQDPTVLHFGTDLLHKYNRTMARLSNDVSEQHVLNYIMSTIFTESHSQQRYFLTDNLLRAVLTVQEANEARRLIFTAMANYRKLGQQKQQTIWQETHELCNRTLAQKLPPNDKLTNHVVYAGAIQLMRMLGHGIGYTSLINMQYWNGGAITEMANVPQIAFELAKSAAVRTGIVSADVFSDIVRALSVSCAHIFQQMSPALLHDTPSGRHLIAAGSHPFVDYVHALLSDVLCNMTQAISRAIIGLDPYSERRMPLADTNAILNVLAVGGLLRGKSRDEFNKALTQLAARYVQQIEPATLETYLKYDDAVITKYVRPLTDLMPAYVPSAEGAESSSTAVVDNSAFILHTLDTILTDRAAETATTAETDETDATQQ